MNKKKILGGLIILVVIVGGVVLYMFNQPHRDVQDTKTDFSFSASAIVNEYLENSTKANNKYLDEEGESKILEISGIISDISEDFNEQTVVLLKGDNDKAGVSCTFKKGDNSVVSTLEVGKEIVIKGEIEQGASYDEDLEMYENVIMGNCAIVK